MVVSVSYSKTPEHRFPRANDDTEAQLDWVLREMQCAHYMPAHATAMQVVQAGGLNLILHRRTDMLRLESNCSDIFMT